MRIPLLLVLLVAAPIAFGGADDDVTRADGPHFRVVLHFEGKGLEKQALASVEALWDDAARLYGLPKGPRKKKLEVHLYRDRNAYEVAEEKLTGGAFKRNLAFAHHDSASAHVAVQPDVSDAVFERIGLPELTRIMLLHEAAHLVRFTAMPNFRDHPDWLTDGVAMYLKFREVAGTRPDALPIASTDVTRVQKLESGRRLPGPAAILADGIDDLAFYDRYAVRWLYFRYLAERHPEALKGTLKRLPRLGGGAKLVGKVKGLLAERIGSAKFRAMDRDWPAFVASLEPEWDETFRSLSVDGTRRVHIAFPDTNALAWRTKPIGKDRYRITGTATILDNYRHQVNLLLDRSAAGFLVVALTANTGVTLFDYHTKEARWERLRFVPRKELVVGKPFGVDLQVTAGRLVLRIDDDLVLDEKTGGRTMKGAWGLGALGGSAGIWEDLVVK